MKKMKFFLKSKDTTLLNIVKKLDLEQVDSFTTDIGFLFIDLTNNTDKEIELLKNNKTISTIVFYSKTSKSAIFDILKNRIDKFISLENSPEKILEEIEEVFKEKELLQQSKNLVKAKEAEKIIAITDLLDSNPNPVIAIFENGTNMYNSSFGKLLEEKPEANEEELDLNCFFEERNNQKVSFFEFDEKKYTNNKVSIALKNGRKYFLVLVQNVELGLKNNAKIFTLNDITVLEYQKLKINHYNMRLEFLIAHKYSNKENKKEFLQTVVKETKDLKTLTEEEREVLKKSHKEKIDAKTYSNDIDEYILEDLRELASLELEINDSIEVFTHSMELDSLYKTAKYLLEYSGVINDLVEFKDLAFAIASLSDTLSNIQELDENKKRKVTLFLSNIMLDLSGWRETVFIKQSTQDIHYIDASLFSSCLQLELAITDQTTEDGEEELELF
ncbi:MAG: hypothetical protein OIF32_01790 [Campylobacterales bacterium]|nr:hypothetical protein [Campylobacterales bacterium]